MGFLRIGLIPAAAALAAIVLMGSLGNWQTHRARDKLAMQQRISDAAHAPAAEIDARAWTVLDPAVLNYRHVRVMGTWRPDGVIYLDNRSHMGRTGMYVLMPLVLATAPGVSAPVLMVNRGWITHDARDRLRIASYGTPSGLVTVEGMVLDHEPRWLELGTAAPPRVGALWQNLDYDRYREASGLDVARLVIRQDANLAATSAAPAEGLVRDWPESAAGLTEQIYKHRGYALQWYALAALLLGLGVFFEIRKRRASAPCSSQP